MALLEKQDVRPAPPTIGGGLSGVMLLVSEGSAAFFDRITEYTAPSQALVTRTHLLPSRTKAYTGGRLQIAVVSITALADERGWYGLTDIPVIWIGDQRHDRRTMDPLGGSRLLPLDFTADELLSMIQSVLPASASPAVPTLASGSRVVARSQTMINLLDEVMAFAGSDQNVLIQGETGTGKELIAELVHQGHRRYSSGPFVAVNCGAIPDGLFESLFFGHTKGSFTGAVQAHRGYLEQASGGTLFMDEVGELPLFQQVKLLRVLESGISTRVGSEAAVRMDFRLVAATNRNLRELVKAGTFRADLFYRLAVIEFNVPNLDQRGGADKIAIFCTILNRMVGADKAGSAIEIPGWVTDQVAAMHFPGNVRQLRNLAERIGVVYQQTGRWDPRLINNALEMVREMAVTPTVAKRGQDVEERGRIIAALEENDWQRQVTADKLGMSRKSLWEKMRKYGIEDGEG